MRNKFFYSCNCITKFFGEGKFGEMLKVDIKLMAEIITKDGVRSNLKLKIL